MPIRESKLLFYVTNNNDSSYSLFNRVTDNLILSEVTKKEVADFLNINNPSHTFLVPSMTPASWPSSVSMTGDYSYDIDSMYSGWDTFPSMQPTYDNTKAGHKQLELSFGEDKSLINKLHKLAKELGVDSASTDFTDTIDCDNEED